MQIFLLYNYAAAIGYTDREIDRGEKKVKEKEEKARKRRRKKKRRKE